MGKILKFKKPKIEDLFMESLSENQFELFSEIMTKIQEEYTALENKLLDKIAECELLKIELNSLKGELR